MCGKLNNTKGLGMHVAMVHLNEFKFGREAYGAKLIVAKWPESVKLHEKFKAEMRALKKKPESVKPRKSEVERKREDQIHQSEVQIALNALERNTNNTPCVSCLASEKVIAYQDRLIDRLMKLVETIGDNE